MDNKIFIGLAMLAFLSVSIIGILLGVSFLINSAGTIGAIVAPFLAIFLVYVVYRVLAKLYKRFIQSV